MPEVVLLIRLVSPHHFLDERFIEVPADGRSFTQ